MTLIHYIEPYMPFISRQYYRYTQGSGVASQMISSVTTALLLVGVWKPTLQYYNIPIVPLAIVFAVMIPLAYFMIGQFLQYIGLYKYMQSFMNQEINPEWVHAYDIMKADHETLLKIAKKMEIDTK